ncbi:MAG: sugar nucleotide-binding protein [Selenomonas sp.]|uniref:sugar nucleotide-binding protein n=1 Tax=Selenomonas sp. TaxID=2053611 RepID=UPI0025E41CDA|nr:sugar nucleotide-binding protein [Selenomonas sp.]MCI6086326.1 sugar nucleotide-binding protein [Selenomonas sp.]
MAAGRALGLGELCKEKPKCLLSFGECTILERQMQMLGACGIHQEDITIVTGYHSEQIETLYPERTLYNAAYKSCDNAHSLFLALESLDDDVLILDGDLVFEKSALDALLAYGSDSLLAHHGEPVYGSTGILEDARGCVRDIGKHITEPLIYDSILYLSRASLNAWKCLFACPEEWKSWYTVSLNKLVKEYPIRIVADAGRVVDIDTFFDYIDAKRIFGIEDFTIFVTGASGLLGTKIYHILKRDYQVKGLQYRGGKKGMYALDLTKKAKVDAFFELHRPQLVIHTAGVAEPEKCKKYPDMARSLNVDAVANLVDACRKYHIKLIHISTDYVFDGERDEPYAHDAERIPKNSYGELKKEAEDLVRAYDNSLIVRLPILYGYNGDDDKVTFPTRVIRSLQHEQKMKLDNKQERYPVLIDEAALAIKSALRQTGIMHITSAQKCTKYTWGRMIAHTFGLPEHLIEEDKDSRLLDRPPHTKLAVGAGDAMVSDVVKGTEILAKQMHCVFRLIYKSRPYATELGQNVARYRYQLGCTLAQQLPPDITMRANCVMPVPNSGLYYAMGLASALHLPYIQGLVKPDSGVRSFQLADIALRTQTIREKITPIAEMVKGRNILLVDEAIFTGVTLKVVCDMLKGCGAGKIYICIPTPICECHCHQYVQPERDLLFDVMEQGEIKDYFGATGVFFQDYDTFRDTLKHQSQICYECFAHGEIGA